MIRNPFDDFTGHFVFHCHILGHEDAGMMQTVDVIRRGERPTPPPGGGWRTCTTPPTGSAPPGQPVGGVQCTRAPTSCRSAPQPNGSHTIS